MSTNRLRHFTICVVLMAIGLLTACGGGRGDIEVDHKVSAVTDPLPGKGPAAGTFRELWTTKVKRTSEYQPSFHSASGQLIMIEGERIQAFDERSGRPSWRYSEPRRNLLGTAFTDGVLVVNTINGGDRITSYHTVGLEASSGKILWENTDRWYFTYDGYGIGGGTPAVANGGTVVVQPKEDDERLGVDARTGDVKWKVSDSDLSDEDCNLKPGTPGSTEALVPVRIKCSPPNPPADSQEAFAAIDAATGEARWSRPSVAVKSTTMMRDGFTLFQDSREASPQILGSDGKVLYAPADAKPCTSCQFFVSSGKAVLPYEENKGKRLSDRDRVAIIDPATHKVVTLPDQGFLQPFQTAGNRLYRAQNLTLPNGYGAILPPIAVSILDPVKGRSDQVPLPLPGFGFGSDLVMTATVVGADGDRLFVMTRSGGAQATTELHAYRRSGGEEPLALGGVSPAEWPEPCSLLAGLPRDNESALPAEAGGRIDLGHVSVPKTSCRLAMPEDIVSLNVLWVAPTAADAATIFGPTRTARSSIDGVDAVRYASGPTFARIGRYIVSVEADEVTTVLPTIAKNLRAVR